MKSDLYLYLISIDVRKSGFQFGNVSKPNMYYKLPPTRRLVFQIFSLRMREISEKRHS